MKTSFYALLPLLLAFSGAASAAQDYRILDGRLDFDVVGGVIDLEGVYGETGRALRIADLSAVAVDGFFWTDAQPSGWRQLNFGVNYRLSYSLLDWKTGAWVATRTQDGDFSGVAHGWGETPDYDYWGVGGFRDPSAPGAVFGPHHGLPQGEWRSGAYGGQTGDAVWHDDTFTLTGGDFYIHRLAIGDAFGSHDVIAVPRGYLHVQPVPEPETYALTAAGLVALALTGRLRSRRG